jgi:hypothetical protein
VISIATKVRIAFVGALAILVVVIPASSASAQELNGIWGPFTRCPVDHPQLLAAMGGDADDPACIVSNSPSGFIKLGNTESDTGASNLQLGATIDSATAEFDLVQPAGGGLVAEPTEVPGGLIGLMCPSNVPLVSALCELATQNDLNRVTATVVSAGEPSNFDLFAGLAVGEPIITLPVKIELDNPLLNLLSSNCSIGSESDPIVLRPANVSPTTLLIEEGDLDGTPNEAGRLARFQLSGSDQADTTFAAPGAQNCGGAGVVAAAINLQQGLPSPSGNNELILHDAVSASIAEGGEGAVTGEEFSDGWHAAQP